MSIRTIILLIILLIAISVFAVLIWYPLGYIMNEGWFEGIFGGYGRIMADYLLIAYIAIICIGTWILLLLYILYILIDPIFVVNIPIFGQIIAAILLNITPFKELRETGVVNFFNNIFGTVVSSESLGRKVGGIFNNTIKFLIDSSKNTIPELTKDKKQQLSKKVVESFASGKSTTNEDELKDIKSCARRQYIINKYDDCIEEKVKDIPSTMGGFQRIKVEAGNNSGQLKCDMEKIKRINCIIKQEQDQENGKQINACQ